MVRGWRIASELLCDVLRGYIRRGLRERILAARARVGSLSWDLLLQLLTLLGPGRCRGQRLLVLLTMGYPKNRCWAQVGEGDGGNFRRSFSFTV